MLLKRSLFFLFLSGCAATVLPQAAIVPGDILTMLRPGATPDDVVKDLAIVDGRSTSLHLMREVSAPMRAWLFHFDTAAVDQAVMLRTFQGHPAVQLAQNNHIVMERNTPDDPQFGQQWQHQNIQSELAWDITTGGVTAAGDTIVVAIIEKADLGHPDLAANAWINRGEIPGNGIDDDGNGYVDDVRGWDPVAGNDAVYSGGHGTEVAGMIGAVGNNDSLVVGANWHVKMMPVNYQDAEEANVITAYTYPLIMRRLYNSTNGAKGAFIVATNASWGVDGGQPADAPLWCAVYDTLGTAGVLNCGSTTNNNVDVDVVGDLPTACPSDFMISVTATNSSDVRTFSGYGATTVDVGAPGAGVFTTHIGGGTGSANGTSFASPLTAGVIALMYSVPCVSLASIAHNDPEEAALRVREALFAGVDQVGNLPGNTVTGGRINAYNSVQLLMDSCAACPVPYNLTATSNAIGEAVIGWSALPGTYALRYRLPGSTEWTTVPGSTSPELALTGLAVCQAYEFQVAADCGTDVSAFSPTLLWTTEGCCTAPLSITATAVDTMGATIAWTTVLASNAYDLRYRVLGTFPWTELDGLSGNNTTISGLAPCSDIEVQMRSTCDGTTADWSTSTALHVPGCGQCVEGVFCTSRGSSAATEWITRVKVNGIDRTSGSDGGYADITTTEQTTGLSIDLPYPIILTPGYATSAHYPEYFTVWLDMDRNGQFTPDELIFDAGNTVTEELNGILTVPATATAGPARMRVVMKYNAAPDNGCTTYDYGETEDYCVTLMFGTAGIDEVPTSMAVRIYPQPADDLLHIAVGHTGALDLMVTDAAGRTVLEQQFNKGNAIVGTERLGTGMYLYRILDQGAAIARGSFMVAH
ncbi:MAG TPA: S8 family serine peptidase [Flavobacteriales bacterium]|mgnify:CR=1 FL=1|nr:S8 family serine peptidase [Flavobacteriales bacterium]QQS71880.1 MAG: S8 family serine peptidase [Flavobacteriales bacterium]HQV37660.1 S8 family serine peptidase [Flavobacteriales bacterium]HQW30796.1 S8 family serine peptidase [Flavobacteriales bacterium]HQY01531.1 S8 family serine peptidase [Flavobacteriales bacterium]